MGLSGLLPSTSLLVPLLSLSSPSSSRDALLIGEPIVGGQPHRRNEAEQPACNLEPGSPSRPTVGMMFFCSDELFLVSK